MTYYLKYRPKNLDEIDLEDVRETLKKIFSSSQIPQAFLFSGPKGSGKTSAARIIAKIVNCENPKGKNKNIPCGLCASCKEIGEGSSLDIIEIDAASHRGIDDIRTLRDAVKLAPTKSSKKVYIIDEAHMLTTEASNALLKTLEEPPEHVIFILATTNPEKLLETIRSRTTNVIFRKANDEEIVRSLKRVAEGEKLKTDDEALHIIAKASGGAFRDAVKTLEHLVSQGVSINSESVNVALRKDSTQVEKFIELISKKDAKSIVIEIDNFVSYGGSVENLVKEVIDKLRVSLLAKIGIGGGEIKNLSKEDTIELIENLSFSLEKMKYSYMEQIPLELALIKWCGEKNFNNFSSGTKVEKPAQKKVSRSASIDVKKKSKEKENDEINNEVEVDNNFPTSAWEKMLQEIKPRNTSTEALLRAAKPIGFSGNILKIGVYYSFHKERLEEHAHRMLVEEVLANILDNNIKIECYLTKPPEKVTSQAAQDKLVVENGETKKNEQEIISEDVVLTEPETTLTEGGGNDIIKLAEEVFGA